MKSIQRRFNRIVEKNPNWSSYVCFAETVKGKKFSKDMLHRWFHKLVNKEEYARNEKTGILTQLENLSNITRTTEIGGKTASGAF